MSDQAVLDLSVEDLEKVEVATRYCVEQVVHEAHALATIARRYPSIPAAKGAADVRAEPIAVVCSGPSLAATWEEIRGFRHVLTCSGAHDFLLERGIVPTWHMEADPRSHKAAFLKRPHADVQYLLAASCHPDVFAAVEGKDVRIWHVAGSEANRAVLKSFPREQWVLHGGGSVGLRALFMARVLGFTKIHVFGMDCSAEPEGRFHAGEHPNEPKAKGRRIAKVGPRSYVTSDAFLTYARQFFKETEQIHDALVTLHGDGLLQAVAEQKWGDPGWVRARAERIAAHPPGPVAFFFPGTISEGYAEMNRELHATNLGFGIGGARHAETVAKMVEKITARSVLDYGCGKGMLGRALPFPIWEYDPAVPGKDSPPRPAELVACTDVLEHVEEEHIEHVLGDLARVTLRVGYFTIHMGRSGKTLPDGRNAHLIQRPRAWWEERLRNYFTIAAVFEEPPILRVVVGPKGAA